MINLWSTWQISECQDCGYLISCFLWLSTFGGLSVGKVVSLYCSTSGGSKANVAVVVAVD